MTSVCYRLSPKAYDKLRKSAIKSGISMAGLTRLVMDSALSTNSGIKSRATHTRKKRVVSDVTIRIQKGIKVRIV